MRTKSRPWVGPTCRAGNNSNAAGIRKRELAARELKFNCFCSPTLHDVGIDGDRPRKNTTVRKPVIHRDIEAPGCVTRIRGDEIESDRLQHRLVVGNGCRPRDCQRGRMCYQVFRERMLQGKLVIEIETITVMPVRERNCCPK